MLRGRRSIRLKGYDYTTQGAYYVTIVTQDMACLLGSVVDDSMRLSDAGAMVQETWEAIPRHYPGVEVDAFVVMPNHIHGVIVLCGTNDDRVDVAHTAQPQGIGTTHTEQPQGIGTAHTGQPQGIGTAHTGQPQGIGTAHTGQPQGVAPTHTPTSTAHPPGHAWTLAVGAGPRACPVGSALSLSDIVHRFKSLTTTRYADGVRNQGWPAFRGRLWQRNFFEHIVRDEDALRAIREYIADNPRRWSDDRDGHPHLSP